MGFYQRAQGSANKLLIGKGQPVTLTHTVSGTYDPATQLISGATTTVQNGTGVIADWDNRQVDGKMIKISDKLLLLSPLNKAGAILTAPVLGDTITDAAGVVYTLVDPLRPVSPAGTAVLYKCNLRA